MTDGRAPEGVVNLFSWANLRGASNPDSSASRPMSAGQLLRENPPELEVQREQAIRDAEAQQGEARRLAAEAAAAQERARQAEAFAQQAAQRVSQLAASLPRRQANGAVQEMADQSAEPSAPAAAAESQAEGSNLVQDSGSYPGRPEMRATAAQEEHSTQPAPPRAAPDERPGRSVRTPWSGPGGRDLPTRPAWLTERRATPSSVPGGSQSPEDSLQGSRERLTSRWFALKTVRGESTNASAAPAPVPVPPSSLPPVLAVFSLAGGVGKTSVVASLGRALASRGERVLLVDAAAYGLLPFFFGARDQRPGQLRTFAPPPSSGDAPIQMIAIEPGVPEAEIGAEDPLCAAIQQHGRGVNRMILDLSTASGVTARRILGMAPQLLVPVLPDMNSVVSVGSIDNFFERHSAEGGKPLLPHYVLNQFDASLPLHLDVREVLREQLGERLLPFVLRRAPAVSEALAEGMTVMDYAPNSTIAEDFGSLAAWVKSQSAPAVTGFRGVRWSEQ